MSHSRAVAIGVSVGLAAVIIPMIVFFIWWYWKKARAAKAEKQNDQDSVIEKVESSNSRQQMSDENRLELHRYNMSFLGLMVV